MVCSSNIAFASSRSRVVATACNLYLTARKMLVKIINLESVPSSVREKENPYILWSSHGLGPLRGHPRDGIDLASCYGDWFDVTLKEHGRLCSCELIYSAP